LSPREFYSSTTCFIPILPKQTKRDGRFFRFSRDQIKTGFLTYCTLLIFYLPISPFLNKKHLCKMCTGIVHILRCPRQSCSAVVLKLREACPGFTCYEARKNGRRGVCQTGINWSHYDRVSAEDCLWCEMAVAGEIDSFTAETCPEGGEPWPEDREGEVPIDGDAGSASLLEEEEEEGEESEDDEEGGAKVR
jgi:hypothetical protein